MRPIQITVLLGVMCSSSVLLAQGTLSIGNVDALQGPENFVITNGSTLHVVFGAGGKIQVTRSAGGVAWENPAQVVSGTVKRVSHPVIGAASDGTMAVAFIAADPNPDVPEIYYTHKPPGGSWTKPVALGLSYNDLAMTVDGTTVYLAATQYSHVAVIQLPVQKPAAAMEMTVDARAMCCPNLNATHPAIALAGPPGGKKKMYIAYGLTIDGTHKKPGAKCDWCADKEFMVGVRVAVEREGKPGDFDYSFADIRSSKVKLAGAVQSVSLSTDGHGNLFLAYSDFFCTSLTATECTAVPGPAFRTMIARYTAATKQWTGRGLNATSGSVDAQIGNPAGGSAFRLTSAATSTLDKTCYVNNILWSGSQLVGQSTPIPSCGPNPQALYFQQACGGTCKAEALYVSGSSPPALSLYPACPPVTLPNLMVRDMKTSPAHWGGPLVVTYVVLNEGTATTIASRAMMTLASGTQVVQTRHRNVPTLSPGAATTIQETFDLQPQMIPGPYTMTVEIDALKRICEGDEGDNVLKMPVTVGGPPSCNFANCTIRGEGVSGGGMRYIVDPGAARCTVPAAASFVWSQRIGVGPWNVLLTGPANSVVVPATTTAYEIQVRASLGTAGCTATHTHFPTGRQPS